MFDLDAELIRLKARTNPPLATLEDITQFEKAMGHQIGPIHSECLTRFGRIDIRADLLSLSTPGWQTDGLRIGGVEASMFWVRELPEQYDLHGYTPLASDSYGMQIIYGPFPDPRVYVFDRFEGPPAVLELIGDNIEHAIQRLECRTIAP